MTYVLRDSETGVGWLNHYRNLRRFETALHAVDDYRTQKDLIRELFVTVYGVGYNDGKAEG